MSQYLHSGRAWIRRLSAIAYSVATAAATLIWVLSGGLDAIREGRVLAALAMAFVVVPAWWITAGISLRVVRFVDRHYSDQHNSNRSASQEITPIR